MTDKVINGRRILWIWCPGHQRYEIGALERHLGSHTFEQLCACHWGAAIPYRITREEPGVSTIDANWKHGSE